MGRKVNADVGMVNEAGGDTIKAAPRPARKPRKASNLRVVKVDGDGELMTLIVVETVSTVKQGVASIATSTPGKYAVICIREVREIGKEEVAYSRKTTL